VVDFLSPDWFEQTNTALAGADPGPVPVEPDHVVRVVLEINDPPTKLPHALTLTIGQNGASIAPGDHLEADLIVRLGYVDARALSSGELDASRALREGRLKVRGDINALVPLGLWMTAAHIDIVD